MTSGTYRYQSEFADSLRAEGQASALLRVLEKRVLQVPPEVREQIVSCTDIDTLDRWLERVLNISSIDQLFD